MAVIDLGDPIPELGITVTNDSTGALADATTIVLTITLPDGTTATPSVTHASTGTYTASYTPATAGRYLLRWVTTGTNVAGSFEDSVTVEDSTTAGIVSLDEVQTGLNNTNTDDDETLRSLILVASDICEQRTKVWRRQTISRTFDVLSYGIEYLQLRPNVVSITSVVENGTTLTTGTGYVVNGETGRLYRGSSLAGLCWLPGRQVTVVTYVAGAPSGLIPASIRQGVIQLVQYQFSQQRGGANLPRNAGFDAIPDPASGWLIPRPVVQLWQPYTQQLVA